MAAPLLLGIDLGTTLIKAAAFDRNGRPVASAAAPSPLCEIAPGRVEQDVEEIRDAAHGAIREVAAALGPRRRELAAVGVTGQMGGITALDAAGHPLIPYDSPLDLRCVPYFESQMLPHLPTIIARTGSSPQWGQKLLYWRDEHPAIWERITKFSTLAGYVAGDLTGLSGSEAFIDRTYAAFSGLCSSGTRWDPDLCSLLHVPREKLPRLVDPHTIIGVLTPQRAECLGLPAGIPVAAGVGDGTASLLGAGALADGALFDLSGTASGCIACVNRCIPDHVHQILNCVPSAFPDVWYLTYVLFGGQAVRWFAEEFSPPGQAAETLADRLHIWDKRAADSLADDSHAPLFFLPHLGGRWFPPRPAVKGGWLGLTWGTRSEHMYVAILKAVAYEFSRAIARMHELLPGWHPREVRVIGGGARSAFWNQLKADILGIVHVPLKEKDFAARGVSLIAGGAAGVISDVRATAMQVEVESMVHPRPDQHRLHQEDLDTYWTVVEDVERLFDRLHTQEVRARKADNA